MVRTLSRSVWSTAEIDSGVRLSNTSAVLSWLEGLVRASDPPSTAKAAELDRREWGGLGGGVNRNPIRSGSSPHPWARWSAVTTVDPRREDRLNRYAFHLQTRARPVASVSQPIAAGDYVFVRTGRNLVAVDFNTGRRVWETRPEAISKPSDRSYAWLRRVAEQSDNGPLTSDALRAWFNPIAGTMAADDRHVYAVESVARAARPAQRWSPFALQRGQLEALLGSSRNRLAAYSIATEGKLAWSVGAGQPGPLSEAYFLGPPHMFGDDLFAVIELDQTICLTQIDAKDGTLIWRQPLVGIERGIEQNTMRRLVGASTAQADGDLICSTGAGVVIAVDLLRRSISWVDRFPVEEGRQAEEAVPWRRRQRSVWPQNAERTWLENRLIVSGDRVLVASTESPQLHCLDRKTGQALWRAPRGAGAFLLAVSGGRVLVGEPQAVRALDIDSGDQLWTAKWSGDAVVGGRAVVLSDQLLTPLSDGSLAVIGVGDGALAERIDCWSGGGAGNLILHRGALLSQTHASLDRYEQSEPLLASARSELEADPGQVAALCIVGESQLCDGQVDDAIETFATAYEAEPASPLARDRLRRALTVRVRRSGPSSEDLALLERLVDSPQQRVALKVQAVELVANEGRLDEAIRLAAGLADEPLADGLLVNASPGLSVSPERRVAGLLTKAWRQASEQTRRDATNRWRAGAKSSRTLSQHEQLVRLFGELPIAESARAGLAEAYRSEGRTLPLALAQSADYLSNSSPRKLASGPRRDPRWSTRQVLATTTPVDPSEDDQPFRVRRGRSAGWRHVDLRTVASLPADAPFAAAIAAAVVDAESGELVGLDCAGVEVYRSQLLGAASGFVRRARAEKSPPVWRFGPCLYLAAGEHVIALEALPNRGGEDRRLWSTESLATTLARAARSDDAAVLPGEVDRVEIDPAAPAKIVAVDARGVVVRKGGGLICLDPLTGGIHWLRSVDGLAGQAACDSRRLYLSGAAGAGKRISLIDGADLGPWTPPEGNWLLNERGLLTTFEKSSPRSSIEVLDLVSGEVVLERRYDGEPRIAVTAGAVVTLDDRGGLEVINGMSGELVLRSEITLRGQPKLFEPMIRQGRLVVTLGYSQASSGQTVRVLGLDSGSAVVGDGTGEVHCLDLSTGKPAWPRPARITRRAPLGRQPQDSPLLVFGSKVETRTTGRSTPMTRLLVLDVATGRTVFRADDLSGNATDAYQIQYRGGESPLLKIALPTVRLAITPLNEAAAPGPPATDIVETGSPQQAAVGGFVRQFQDVFGGAIQPKQAGGPAEDDDD
ncbi:MAG: PQQ-binding-like beta-propeller repeat protein [Planctomycetota bacterium]